MPPDPNRYDLRIPARLAPFVDCLYAIEGDHSAGLDGVVIPDGHVEFVFSLEPGWSMQRLGEAPFSRLPRAFAYAQRVGSLGFQWPDRVSLAAFRTTAPVAEVLLGEPLGERWDEPVDLLADGRGGFERTLDQLTALPFQRRLDCLEGWIARRLRHWRSEVSETDRVIRWFMRHGRHGRIRDHVDRLGIAHRTLSRHLTRTGLTLRDYRQLGRILASVAMLRHSQRSIADVGIACGFYDHAEYTRRFRRITGLTPTEVRAIDTVHAVEL